MKYVLGGWQISGITRFWSGTPINVYMGGCSNCYVGNAGNFVGLVRPDRGSGSPYLSQSDHVHWLNPAAFVAPVEGTVGNIGRNAFRGPGINNWDMSLFKNINFTESRYVQLRLETFNTFNHTNWANIGGTLGSSTFGQVTAARDPRIAQLALKLYF